MLSKNIKNIMKEKDNRDALQEGIKQARELIREQENTVVRPEHEELVILNTLIKNLHELNNKTFEVHAAIESLELREDYIAPSAYNVEMNTLQQRLDNANYQAFRIKKQIKIKTKKFYKFEARIPIVSGNRVFKYETHYYNKVDQKIQNITNEADNALSYGEKLMKEYRKIYGDTLPKELQ